MVIRQLLIVLFILFNNTSYSKDSLRFYRYSSFFLAGVAEGYSDVLQFHYHNFELQHSTANQNFWNPAISWQNKYSSKIPFAKTAFVFTTDGWHLSKFVKNNMLFVGVCIPLQRGKKWWWYVKEGAICYGINRVGFNIIYNGIYR